MGAAKAGAESRSEAMSARTIMGRGERGRRNGAEFSDV